MKMHVARRLSEAIGSWLHLEFCCYRAGLFSENSLKAAVGLVLSSFSVQEKGVRVYADFPHDLLNPQGRKLGANKKLDFALALAGDGVPKRNVKIAVETKWAGSSHCKPENIFEDFLRLVEIKRGDPETDCVFILAGFYKNVAETLDKMPFASKHDPNTGIGRRSSQKKLVLNHAEACHKKYFSKPVKSLASIGFVIPEFFVCRAYGLYPCQTERGTIDFQAIAWEIVSISDKSINLKKW